MADTSSAWAARPTDIADLSSDEDDFVSSQSTTSVEPETLAKQHLSTALGRLHLDQVDSSHSSATRTSTPRSETSTAMTSNTTPQKEPLQLLDLPLDVLKEIIKEVTQTSDLTSLALTCSALHSLIIPHMYCRFDIVWPESLDPSTEDYSGVDALSYGLSTLVMGEDVFHQLPFPQSTCSTNACPHCGCDRSHHSTPSTPRQTAAGIRSRRGNYYAQYTRTFSIGNGPLNWVQEYSVNKEVGKMLGTLVALAVARMVNLEAFIWDMPTGVVREIWLALASLADRPGHNCRLERIWVRWHDNSESSVRNAPPTATRLLQKYKHVEHPSLSVLPPLKSVTVLDIDEPAYVEELAVLIERSRHRLTELRIGIAVQAYMSKWLLCETNSDPAVENASGWPRPDGVLGILARGNARATEEQILRQDDSATVTSTGELSMPLETSADTSAERGSNPPASEEAVSPKSVEPQIPPASKSPPDSPTKKIPSPVPASEPDHEMLKLEVLELERVPLSVPTLLPAIDWTRLTTLTVMRCEDHEKLWRALRRKYTPPVSLPQRSQDRGRRRSSSNALDYSLNLKQLRTDTVSPYLMLFIKDALAPNTLESVYLHEAPHYSSAVQIDAIYRHILRKHRLSLRKLLVDASECMTIGTDMATTQWHKWMFNHEVVSFVTSGRMPQLKELGMAMHYRDWHYFLQRLPNMPQFRALYLPHIGNSVHRNLKELALQVLDIVSIRPELNIAYVGLQTKCYQILESSRGDGNSDLDDIHGSDHAHTASDGLSSFSGDQPGSSDDDEDGEDEDDHEHSPVGDLDLLLSDDDSWSEDSESEPDDSTLSRVQFQLREILFYDEKISIFKARHGVL